MQNKVINFSEIKKKESQINIGLPINNSFEDLEDVIDMLSNYQNRGWVVRIVDSIGEEEYEDKEENEKFIVARFNFIANLGVVYICTHKGKIVNCVAVEFEKESSGTYKGNIKEVNNASNN